MKKIKKSKPSSDMLNTYKQISNYGKKFKFYLI